MGRNRGMRQRVQYEKDIGNTFDLVIESHWRIDPNGQLTKQEYYAFGGGRYNSGTWSARYFRGPHMNVVYEGTDIYIPVVPGFSQP